MPRSNRFSGYASAEEEEEVICPYNKQHRIRVSQIQQHLAVCRKGLQGRSGPDVKVCPFNRNHHVSAAKYDEHVANCPDASFEDNGFDGGRFERAVPRKQRNGHDHGGFEQSPERHDSDARARPSHLKQSGFDGRQAEQYSAPKGFKISKGFGFTGGQDSGNFVRDRSSRVAREDNFDRFDDSTSYGGRSRKGYIRSKSNMDEESIRQAQRNAVEQVREFQNVFDQRASANHSEEHEGFTRLREWEPDRFTKLREPPAFTNQQQRGYHYDGAPVERKGYGRGKQVVESNDAPRPGGGWGRIRSEPEDIEPEYKEELLSSNRGAATVSSRFKIVKASSVFGPVEVAAPASCVGAIGKSFPSSTAQEEDWGGGGRRFTILKASDVFRLDPDHDSRGRREDGSHFRNHRGRDSFGRGGEYRPSRRFDVKHPDELFSNGQPMAPRFARARTPPEVVEPKKPELPWPFNRFAENPNLGRRNEDEARRQVSVDADDDNKFQKASAFARQSPLEKSEAGSVETPNGEGADDDARSCEHSECEVMSTAETVSSGGGRIYKRVGSGSPLSQGNDRAGSEISEMAAASSAKPKVLSIYEQYEQFGLDDDDLNFLKPAENLEPIFMPEPNMGAIFAHLQNIGIGQSPAFGSSHSSSPYSSLAP